MSGQRYGGQVFSRERFRDWILLLVCNLIWSSQYVLVKTVQKQMGPIAATSIPMCIATLLLAPIVNFEARKSPTETPRSSLRDNWMAFLVIGVCGQVAAQLFITWGVRFTLASNAALLMLALPIITSLVAHLVLGETMGRIRWISFGLALAGIAECSGVNWKTLNLSNSHYVIGNLLILASVCGSAFYNVYSKKLLSHYTPLQVLLYSYYFAVAFLIPITIVFEPGFPRQAMHYAIHTWIGIALLAGLLYFSSMVLFLMVLTRLDATQASLSNYMIPFFGVVIAAIVLHERLTISIVIGGALVLLSTLLITVHEERTASRHASGRLMITTPEDRTG